MGRELAVVVLPFAARRDFLGGVAVLRHFAICESKQVVEGAVNAPVVDFAAVVAPGIVLKVPGTG